MKTNVLYLVALFFLLFSGGCSKVDDGWVNEELFGVWFDVRDYADQDQTRTVEWSFMEDETMEIIYIEYKKSTGDFLGYSVL